MSTERERVLVALVDVEHKLSKLHPQVFMRKCPDKTDVLHLLSMCRSNDRMDVGKMNRWLGFIQGVMCARECGLRT